MGAGASFASGLGWQPAPATGMRQFASRSETCASVSLNNSGIAAWMSFRRSPSGWAADAEGLRDGRRL